MVLPERRTHLLWAHVVIPVDDPVALHFGDRRVDGDEGTGTIVLT